MNSVEPTITHQVYCYKSNNDSDKINPNYDPVVLGWISYSRYQIVSYATATAENNLPGTPAKMLQNLNKWMAGHLISPVSGWFFLK